MSRPLKWRNVCSLPANNQFVPAGRNRANRDHIVMTVDEYEAIRLIDLEGLTQEECAARMNVARTTVQAIYSTARHKIADALVNGKALGIEGGEYRLCDGRGRHCGGGGKGCRRKDCERQP